MVALPSCPYEAEGRCFQDPLIPNLLTSCRGLKLLQDGCKVFVWMAFPFSGKTGRALSLFYNFPYNFYESEQLASKSLGGNCPCDPNQVTEASSEHTWAAQTTWPEHRPGVNGYRRRLEFNHRSWLLKTVIKKEAVKYGITPYPVFLLIRCTKFH